MDLLSYMFFLSYLSTNVAQKQETLAIYSVDNDKPSNNYNFLTKHFNFSKRLNNASNWKRWQDLYNWGKQLNIQIAFFWKRNWDETPMFAYGKRETYTNKEFLEDQTKLRDQILHYMKKRSLNQHRTYSLESPTFENIPSDFSIMSYMKDNANKKNLTSKFRNAVKVKDERKKLPFCVICIKNHSNKFFYEIMNKTANDGITKTTPLKRKWKQFDTWGKRSQHDRKHYNSHNKNSMNISISYLSSNNDNNILSHSSNAINILKKQKVPTASVKNNQRIDNIQSENKQKGFFANHFNTATRTTVDGRNYAPKIDKKCINTAVLKKMSKYNGVKSSIKRGQLINIATWEKRGKWNKMMSWRKRMNLNNTVHLKRIGMCNSSDFGKQWEKCQCEMIWGACETKLSTNCDGYRMSDAQSSTSEHEVLLVGKIVTLQKPEQLSNTYTTDSHASLKAEKNIPRRREKHQTVVLKPYTFRISEQLSAGILFNRGTMPHRENANYEIAL